MALGRNGALWTRNLAYERIGVIAMLTGGWVMQFFYSAGISQFEYYDTVVIFVVFWFTGSGGFFFGTLFGILFGIPKAPAVTQTAEGTTTTLDFLPNRNIEEISDWLTKIIVGLTLVNIRDIVSFIVGIGQTVATATVPVHGLMKNPGAEIIAITSVLYGFVCGFLYFYFWSRSLNRHIVQTETAEQRAQRLAKEQNEGRLGRRI